MCALSQEGSLGSFSDSDRSFARRIEAAAESVPAQCLTLDISGILVLHCNSLRNGISWHIQSTLDSVTSRQD